jgi:hypothetical protein
MHAVEPNTTKSLAETTGTGCTMETTLGKNVHSYWVASGSRAHMLYNVYLLAGPTMRNTPVSLGTDF